MPFGLAPNELNRQRAEAYGVDFGHRDSPMRRHLLLSLPLMVAAIMTCLLTTATAQASDPECDVIMPVAEQLETAFNRVWPWAVQPAAAVLINNAESPLFGLVSPAAVDLRIRSSMLASRINGASALDTATPDQVTSDLDKAKRQLVAARLYCAT